MKKIFMTLSLTASALVLVVACGSGSNNGSSTVGVPTNCSSGQPYSNVGGCLVASGTCGANAGQSISNGQCYNIDGYSNGVGTAGYGTYGTYGTTYGGGYVPGYAGYGGGYRPGSYGYANSYANGYYNGLAQPGYYGGGYGNSAYFNLSVW